MREGIVQVLSKMGHSVCDVPSGPQGLAALRKGEETFDLVVTDYKMLGMNGIEVVEQVKEHDPSIDVILITAYGSVEMAVDAMKRGASDYITKPFPPDVLRARVHRVLELREAKAASQRLGEQNAYLREALDVRYNFGEMVGGSACMADVFGLIEKVTASDSAVLITGESGTGKELVARAIHRQSARRDGPFVKVNCGALAEGVLESELFGHEKGSFTGALRMKKGKFELADGGTVFLDEIGDVPPGTQMRLLRVLQEKEFDRVGGEKSVRVDVRVVVATNKDLRGMVRQGSFREDLYYRLNIIPIHLPPLRERREDIPDLVGHFLEKQCGEMNIPVKHIAPKAMEALCNYNWPGNVRELENIIERAVVLCDSEEIGLNDIPLQLKGETVEDRLTIPKGDIPLNEMLESLEKQLLERAFERARGVKTRMAAILGIKTSALYYKLEKYGML
jgi:two-component system response regulator HydG